MQQIKFCIDTNVLFSFQKGIDVGENPSQVANMLSRAVKQNNIIIYMPPRIIEELEFMVTPETKEDIHTLLTHVIVQSPSPHTQTIGAQALYDFVGENRTRTLQGLHTAEDLLVQTAQQYSQTPISGRVDLQKSLQPLKESLRNRFRNATRTGFIDSIADLDLIFLAQETDSFLVTADEGVLVWGRKLGAKEMGLPVFGTTIKQSLE